MTAAQARRHPARVRETVHRAPTTWTTPALLRLCVYGLAAGCALFMIAVLTGAKSHTEALQAIGERSGPHIVVAQHIASALEDMDGEAADALASNSSPEAIRLFQARRQETEDAILGAAENITLGDAERVQIRVLALGLSNYSAQVEESLYLEKIDGKNGARALDAYEAAAKTLDDQLIPAAAQLAQANRAALESAYAHESAASSASLLFLGFSGVFLCCALLATQAFLARRMRRILNPMLLAATGLAFIFLVFSVDAFRLADGALDHAKEGSFASLDALWHARTAAYSARGYASRALLDGRRLEQYRKQFDDKADEVLRRDLPAASRGHESMDAAMTLFATYQKAESGLRYVKQAAAQSSAAAQAQDSFDKFTAELNQSLADVQTSLAAATSQGLRDVSGFEISTPLVVLAIACLAYLGLLPRIREYST